VLTPGGSVDTATAVLALATLVLRGVVVFVVPAIVVYRIAMRAMRRWTEL
jgi:hypothetical protein